MANRLADLNRQKRDYAFSGKANVGDVPWLYGIQAEQAAGNRPAGIGDGGGGMADSAAPNPQGAAAAVGGGGAGGGGTTGGADTGLPGPGQTGLGGEFDNLFSQWQQGGQAGEPGGLGRDLGDLSMQSIENAIGGYSTIGTALSSMTGIPGLGLIGSGIDTYNDYGRADKFDPSYDPTFGDVLSAYGYDVTGGLLGESMHSDAINDYQGRTGTGLNDAALGQSTSGKPGTYSGPKGVVGPQGGGGTAESGYGGGGYSGGFGGQNQPGGGWGQGGGAGGESSGDLGSGGRHGELHTGGYVSEDEVPGQLRGDVPKTLQEGEGVISADAMQVLGGPGFIEGINMMARMMRGR